MRIVARLCLGLGIGFKLYLNVSIMCHCMANVVIIYTAAMCLSVAK